MKTKKQSLKIAGITIWRILAYFIIYSIVGYIIETTYGFLTKGVIESRQGFLYGPFCSIYGIGAIIMIISLQYFKKNNYTLFFGGFLVGSVVEYLISFFGELLFNVKWWDYSDRFLNLNGRICFTFSLFWGLLAIYLIRHFNPLMDKLMNKIKEKIPTNVLKVIVIIAIMFLIIDFLLTGVALKLFFARTVYIYDLDVANKDKYISQYQELMKNEKLLNFGNKIFSDEKMIKTFPNLKLETENGEMIFLNSIYKDIQPYYYNFN